MEEYIGIYLAGSIQKGHEKVDESYWTEMHREILSKGLFPYKASFLNPAHRTDDLSDQHSVFGRDMLQVYSADIVFVDARQRRGLGVGAEMMWAKMNQIPAITWAPKESHYYKSNTSLLGVSVTDWVHPFVESLSDHIVDTLEEGAQWIKSVVSNPTIEIKGRDHISSAMQHYMKTQLPHDEPMKRLLEQNNKFKETLNKQLFSVSSNL